MIRGGNMIILKMIEYVILAYLLIWALQFIWGTIGFCLLLKESGNNQDFIRKVSDLTNKDKTKWLLLKWPLVLYRMKRNKRP